MRLTEKLEEHYITRYERVNGKIIGNQMCLDKLGELEDLEEQCIEENRCGLRELLLKWKAFFGDIAELYDYRKAEEQGLLHKTPCKIGDEFWVIAYCDRKVTHVRCTGYGILEDAKCKIKDAYIWIDSLENEKDYWKLSFEEFRNQCFHTKEEAESALAEKGGA